MVEQGFGWRRAHARGVVVAMLRGIAIALLVALAGCATIGGLTKDSPPEVKNATVTERVKAKWAALIDGNLDLAYTYLSPASREIMSLESYKRQARGSGYREAKVETVECEGAVCKVRLMVMYDHRLMKGLITPVDEKWVIDEGKAWYVWGQ
jgi:hypothetical protein